MSLIPVTVPPFSLTPIAEATDKPGTARLARDGDIFVLDNGILEARFSPTGALVKLWDREADRHAFASTLIGNRFVLFDDRPVNSDAWDVDAFHLEKPLVSPTAGSARVLEEGPLRVGLEFIYEFPPSCMTQRIFLVAGSRTLEFECEVDWQHLKTFLKVEFPVPIRASEATYEIQFGHVKRATHVNTSHDEARFEVCAQRWIDLGEPDYGYSLFTDSKYGFSVREDVMRISLLRGPGYPDPNADRGRHHFRFALFPHPGTIQDAQIVRRAAEFNLPWRLARSQAESIRWLSLDQEALVLDGMKKAENTEAMVIRLYEAYGTQGEATVSLHFPVSSAALANILEDIVEPLVVQDGKIKLSYRPFQILTLLLFPVAS